MNDRNLWLVRRDTSVAKVAAMSHGVEQKVKLVDDTRDKTKLCQLTAL